MRAAVYEMPSGRVLWVVEGPEDAVMAQAVAGTGILVLVEGQDALPDQHYVAASALLLRPAIDVTSTLVAIAGEPLAIPGVPAGSAIAVDGDPCGVTETAGLTLRFDMAETYSVQIRPPFPWRTATVLVTVA